MPSVDGTQANTTTSRTDKGAVVVGLSSPTTPGRTARGLFFFPYSRFMLSTTQQGRCKNRAIDILLASSQLQIMSLQLAVSAFLFGLALWGGLAYVVSRLARRLDRVESLPADALDRLVKLESAHTARDVEWAMTKDQLHRHLKSIKQVERRAAGEPDDDSRIKSHLLSLKFPRAQGGE